jgi:3-dehydroquinate dehydratase II
MRKFARRSERSLSIRIFVLNGVNLGTLGIRRPEIYGTMTLDDIERLIKDEFPALNLEFKQTDSEGEMVAFTREAAGSDGLVINAGAWTHYSYALHDALEALDVPKVEVHLSNVHTREEWRRVSVISPVVDALVAGMGAHGYVAAVRYILERGPDQSPPSAMRG